MARRYVPSYPSTVTRNRPRRELRGEIDKGIALAKWDWLVAFNTNGNRLLTVVETVDGLLLNYITKSGLNKNVIAEYR